MTRCKPKTPRAQKGETLAEVLVAMLIVAVSALLLAAMTSAAASINIAAHKQDAEFYASMNKVEAMDSSTEDYRIAGKAVIKDETGTEVPPETDVWIYHDGDLTLYRKAVP